MREILVAEGLTILDATASQTNPIEILKVRMQTQGAAAGHQHAYNGAVDALHSLWQQEGSKGFTKGLATSVLRLTFGRCGEQLGLHCVRSIIFPRSVLNTWWTGL